MGAAQGPVSAKDDLFAGAEKFAKGASDVTEVNMDPDSLGMVEGGNAKRAHDMVLNTVRSYTYDKPGMYRMEDVDEFRRKLETGDWRCSVHVRELKTGQSTDVCNRRRADGMVETAIITVEPKELTFIHTIRRPRDKGVGNNSLLEMPAVGAALGPEMAARMAAIGPEVQARMQAMEPLLEARMAASQPEMQARIAAMQAQVQAAGAGLSGLGKLPPMPPMPAFPAVPAAPSAPATPRQ